MLRRAALLVLVLASAVQAGDDPAPDPPPPTYELTHTLTGHKDLVRTLTFVRDGTQLATGSADWKIKLWDTADATELATLSGHM